MMREDETSRRVVTADDEVRRATTAARSGDNDNHLSEAAPQRRLSTKQKIGAGLVAVLSVALIAVSATWLLPSSPDTEPSPPSAVPAPAEEKDIEADVPESEEAPVVDEESSTPVEEPQTPAPQAEAPASQEPTQQSAAPSSAIAPPADPAPATVSVTVSVSSSAVGNPVSGGATPSFNQGATAYDALMACGLSVNASSSSYGVYVSAIGGLAEKEHGGGSGWVYSVNGADPGVSCSAYVLKDGDAVEWFYVV